jgi:formate-dependent nitrite reductase membrane component NrfD
MSPFAADPGWGWWIIGYFYLGGVAAGAYFAATLIELFGRPDDQPVARAGFRLALPLVAVCGVFLIVDLDHPDRFWHMMFQSEAFPAPMLKVWSPMSVGAWALGLFGVCAGVSFVCSCWPAGWPAQLLQRRWLKWSFQLVGCGVGFFVASYTGVLLAATNQPVWVLTDWTGALFLTSAASTGLAALLLLAPRHGSAESVRRLEHADLWALLLELAALLLFLASLNVWLGPVLETWQGLALLAGTLGVGLLLPLALHLLPSPPGGGEGSGVRGRLAAGCALVGGLVLRWAVVTLPPHFLNLPRDWPEPADTALWHSWPGKILVLGTFALALLLPLRLKQVVPLRPWPVLLAGCAGLLVGGAVLAYALRPWSERERETPFAWPALSPEDGRPRGGGVGASAANRPEPLRPRSKIFQAAPP